MSVKKCITAKVKAGELAPHRVEEITELYDEIEAEARASMSAEAATAFADTEIKRLVKRQFDLERRQTLLQAAAQVRIDKQLDSYRTAKGQKDPAAALIAQFAQDDMAKGVSPLEARHKAVQGLLHAKMAGVLRSFRRTATGGVRNPAQMNNLVREAFGEHTGDTAARELAEAWADAAEAARVRFNAAGGDIGKRSDWGLPQAHDSMLVRKAGFETWAAAIKPRLDPARMIDPLTELPIKPERLDDALKAVYETISTDGWAKIKPSGAARGHKLANRRADHRFLVFKDAESWLEYNSEFGARDPFSAMVSHIDGMARDIALLETFGPNPTSTIRWAQETVQKRAALTKGAEDVRRKADNKAKTAIDRTDAMLAIFDGSALSPVNSTAARIMGDVRNVLTSAQLGGAFLSATSDVSFQRMAAKYNGLSTTRALGNIVRLMGDDASKEQLVRAGLVAENWTEGALGMARYQQDFMGGEWSRRLADTVMRVSGLSPWTQNGRFAFGWEFMGTMAENSSKAFEALDAPFKRSLERYGIDGAAWDKLRAVKPYRHQGVRFLRPEDVAQAKGLDPVEAQDLATRYLEMIQTEMEFAVPTASLRARATLNNAKTNPGGALGEVVRAGKMYKNFPITLFFTHIRRAMNEFQGGSGLSRLGYATDMVISTTLMGAFAMQMKDMAKGRDPRPMTGEHAASFWGAASLQGGGLGLFGDLLFADLNRFGGGFAASAAGPVANAITDVANITAGNFFQAINGEDTNFGREAVRLAKRYTPGSSLWYGRLALERSLFDRLDTWADPVAARRSQRKRVRDATRDYGTGYWWAPGQATPNRAPELDNATQ